MLTYSRYKFTRFWAVYDEGTLLCITVYLKGALAVIERITGMKPERPKRKKAEKKKPIPPKPIQSRHNRGRATAQTKRSRGTDNE